MHGYSLPTLEIPNIGLDGEIHILKVEVDLTGLAKFPFIGQGLT